MIGSEIVGKDVDSLNIVCGGLFMNRDWLGLIRHALHRPPRIVFLRFMDEVQIEAERFLAPLRAKRFDAKALLRATGDQSLDEIWSRLASCTTAAYCSGVDPDEYDTVCPGDRERILTAADRTLDHEVDLLGSGPVKLGSQIDWQKDYKTEIRWSPAYIKSIKYNNPDRPSDVKFPWEVSRMQWLIPAGQAYLMTGDECYAVAVRDILGDWISENPYARSVNWACTMEVALRILSWTWLFHVFHQSRAWADAGFRERFLCTLFLHGNFTERHIERSDVNGNHYTADAAGLVFAGLFFGSGKDPQRWQKLGWDILCDEFPRQVFPDGVDFEGSVCYHRLVTELFFLPALYREKCGFSVPDAYRERVIAMARFAAIYSRPHGMAPLWGDADDARALPFGGQSLNDHRYLAGVVGAAWDVPELRQSFAGPLSEVFWLLGPGAAALLPNVETPETHLPSQAFTHGGFYIMRNDRDHVFIDCGPLGLAGRGGHGHNDCLSFEAVLDSVHLVSDCGAYLYTASYQERNNFRSTAYHNTPRLNGEEINRFIRWDYLWNLHYDALPEVRRWETGAEVDIFCGAHSGYQRLNPPVTPVREIVLNHILHALIVNDKFEGDGVYRVQIPLHLAPGVEVLEVEAGRLRLCAGGRTFELVWGDSSDWTLEVGKGRVSPSYGVILPAVRLLWGRNGSTNTSLVVGIAPKGAISPGLLELH